MSASGMPLAEPDMTPLKTEETLRRSVRARLDRLTKPQGSLGRLEDLVVELCVIQGDLRPKVSQAELLLFAADHGISDEGVSAFPRVVTAQMVVNFLRGGAAASVLSRLHGCGLRVIDVGVDADLDPHPLLQQSKIARGTANMLHADAMSTAQLQQALQIGRDTATEAIDRGNRVLLFGEMGIGNTSASSLLLAGFSGSSLAECVGPGTGLDTAGVARKLAILEQVRGRSAASPLPSDPVAAAHAMLQRWGGFEIAALVGAIGATVAARAVPLIDGFSVSVAALIADRLAPGVLRRCVFSHCSAEPAHAHLLRRIGVEPLLSLGLRLGEGSGALLALPLLRSSVAFYEQMASFDDAGVSDRPKEDGP